MKRCLFAALLLVLLGPACKTGAPEARRGAAALPAPLLGYVDELRVLRHEGDERTITVTAQKRLAGDCDVAVQVRAVAYERRAARFSLETVGLPEVGGREPRCEARLSGMQLVLSDLPAATDEAEMTARVDAVLQTPEAYLESRGVAFDRPSEDVPAEVASNEFFATTDERTLGRQVTAWPKPLLSVDPWHHDLSGRVRQQSEVEVEAVVGTDGRLHRSRVRTGLSATHEQAVLRALALWRFEPARRGDEPIGARIVLRPVLTIY